MLGATIVRSIRIYEPPAGRRLISYGRDGCVWNAPRLHAVGTRCCAGTGTQDTAIDLRLPRCGLPLWVLEVPRGGISPSERNSGVNRIPDLCTLNIEPRRMRLGAWNAHTAWAKHA